MPRYDFVCPKCGTVVQDVTIKCEERNEQICDKCGEKLKINYQTFKVGFKNVN